MKKFLLFAAVFGYWSVAHARITYNPEVLFGCSFNYTQNSTFHFHTVQGIGIGEYLSTGIGIGIDYYDRLSIMKFNPLTHETSVSTYLNCKAYLPLSGQNTKLFLSMDVGGAFGISHELRKGNGRAVVLTPSGGIRARISPQAFALISMGISNYRWRIKQFYGPDVFRHRKVSGNVIHFKIGLGF